MFVIYTKNKNKVLLFGYSECKHYRRLEINTNRKFLKSPSLDSSIYLRLSPYFIKLAAHNGTKCYTWEYRLICI